MGLATRHRERTKTTAVDCCGCSLRLACTRAGLTFANEGDNAHVARRRYVLPCGEKLYVRNAPLKALFLICNGALKTQRETVDGDLVVTGFFLAGDIVGADAIAERRFPGEAVATTDCEVCELSFEALLAATAHSSGLNVWLLSQLSSYTRRKDSDLSWPCGRPTRHRVLRFFLELSERLGQASPLYQATCDLPIRKQDIARYLCMTPETLSRNLALLRQEGLLQLGHKSFTLPDTARAYRITRI